MIKFFIKILFLLPLINNIVFSQKTSFHPNSDKVIFTTEFGFTHTYSDYKYPKPELLSRGSIEYFFPTKSVHSFGLKLLGGVSNLNAHSSSYLPELKNKSFNTSIFFLGAGLTYARQIGYTVSYISIVKSHLRIDPRNSNGEILTNNFFRKYSQNQSMYVAEFGIRFIINNFWSTNLGFNYNLTNTDYLDDLKIGKANDTFLSVFIGISIYHGGDIDGDNDGVIDKKDLCPSTPNGVEVNEFGCPLGSDGDGIPDFSDESPYTANYKIDNFNEIDPPIQIVTQDTSSKNEKILEKTESNLESSTMILKEENNSILKTYNFEKEITLKDSYFTDGKLFCYQIAAFKSKEVAENLVKKLNQKDQKVFIIEATPFGNEEIWYRIRIGYFNTLEEAKKQKRMINIK